MFPIIAAVIAIAVIAMMWRFLDNEVARRSAEDGEQSEPDRPRPNLQLPRRAAKPQMIAPDDDPDFLRELGKQIGKKRDDEQTA